MVGWTSCALDPTLSPRCLRQAFHNLIADLYRSFGQSVDATGGATPTPRGNPYILPEVRPLPSVCQLQFGWRVVGSVWYDLSLDFLLYDGLGLPLSCLRLFEAV